MCQFSITSTNSLDLLFWALFYNARLLCFCSPLWISTHELILSAWTSLSSKTRGEFSRSDKHSGNDSSFKMCYSSSVRVKLETLLYAILQERNVGVRRQFFFSVNLRIQSIWTFRWTSKKTHYLLNPCTTVQRRIQ